MQKKLKWTETCFSSCYCSCNLFQARLTEKKFRPDSAFTLLDARPPLVQQKFTFLASSILQECLCHRLPLQMWCCQCVSSQLDTHIAEVLTGIAISVNAPECWYATGPSRLVKDLTSAAASQAYVERIFSACGLLYSGRRMCPGVSRWAFA